MRATDGPNDDGTSPALNLRQLQDVFTGMRADLVRFLARRTGDAQAAADLSHDVFEKLASVEAVIPSEEKARSYILRMASNLAVDRHRVEKRRIEIVEGSQILFEDEVLSPEEVVISRDRLLRIERILEELPPKVREVLVLARMREMPRKAVAAALGISVSLVEKYQLRALTHLRTRLDELE